MERDGDGDKMGLGHSRSGAQRVDPKRGNNAVMHEHRKVLLVSIARWKPPREDLVNTVRRNTCQKVDPRNLSLTKRVDQRHRELVNTVREWNDAMKTS